MLLTETTHLVTLAVFFSLQKVSRTELLMFKITYIYIFLIFYVFQYL